MRSSRLFRCFSSVLPGLIVAGISVAGMPARAQDSGSNGYAIGEDRPQRSDAIRDAAEEGPVRLARFSYIQGNVTWRADDTAEWSVGTTNLPLRQGAQIWVSGGGRAEIQFDDGSLLRLGNDAVVTLQTLYSDAEGEFTEIKLTDGLAALRLKHERSVFQIDTPLVSVKSVGPARLRIGAGSGVEVGVRAGAATVEGPEGRAELKRGDYLDLENGDSPLRVRPLPRDDSWERWNDERDANLAAGDEDNRVHRVPSNIALVANDLNSYGDWQQEPQYGWVWCPRTTAVDWRPYQYGHWTWVNPFGWTWVSDEPWGWAPYHYGTWTHFGQRWGWVPGPVTQCWSPAVVHFTEYDSRVAWCPLAPSEVRYSSAIRFGVRGNSWSLYFSIGQAAVYYPTSAGYCAPTVFRTNSVNRFNYGGNGHDGFNRNGSSFNEPSAAGRFRSSNEFFATNNNTYLNNRFVPMNSRLASGVTASDAAQFGGRGRYEGVGQNGAGLFQRGRGIGAPTAGNAPLAGPTAIKPTSQALTPSRTFLSDSRGISKIADKPIYRAPLRASIERSSAPIRTLPFDSAGTRMPSERNGAPSGRTTASVRRGDTTILPGSAGSASRTVTRGEASRDVDTSPQGRARSARRALGQNDETGRAYTPPQRTGGGVPNSGQTPGRTNGGNSSGGVSPVTRGSSPGNDPGTGAGTDGRRNRGNDGTGGQAPPAGTRREDTPRYGGAPRGSDNNPRTTEPRRDPTPTTDPRRTYPGDTRREVPQPPTRTPDTRRETTPQPSARSEEPRREAPQPRREETRRETPQPPVRREEPRREAPQPPVQREESRRETPQPPARTPEPRRDPVPVQRRTPPADPPRKEKSDDNGGDSSKTPPSGSSRSRR